LSGEIPPGEWLRQEPLAERLGVSQATVREALKRLVSEGLAVHVPHKGVKAVTLSIDDLEDIYDIRAYLEGLANRLASARISEADLSKMKKLLPHTVVTSTSRSTDTAREANQEFHWIAIRASGRTYLIRLLAQVWGLMDPYMVYGRFLDVKQSLNERLAASELDLSDHARLVKALENKDGDGAQALTEEYVRRSFKELEEQIRKSETATTLTAIQKP
jgi:DNA-binding GntR family transcriptional regulator